MVPERLLYTPWHTNRSAGFRICSDMCSVGGSQYQEVQVRQGKWLSKAVSLLCGSVKSIMQDIVYSGFVGLLM